MEPMTTADAVAVTRARGTDGWQVLVGWLEGGVVEAARDEHGHVHYSPTTAGEEHLAGLHVAGMPS